jgi:hypothetical protein
MPYREHKEGTALSLVVDEVPDAAEEETPYTRSSRSLIPGSYARLLGEQGYGFAEVGAKRSWSGRAILCPPLGCLLDLLLGRKS